MGVLSKPGSEWKIFTKENLVLLANGMNVREIELVSVKAGEPLSKKILIRDVGADRILCEELWGLGGG